MTKKIYLTGKIAELPMMDVSQMFGRVQKKLMDEGHVPYAAVDFYIKGTPFKESMQIRLFKLLCCDELHMLPNWKDSRSARLEREVAMRLSMPIIYL